MVKSMTGFGRSQKESNDFSVTVEMKTVNHRFCEYHIRMPRQLLRIEEKIKKQISEYVQRGRVEVFITLEGNSAVHRKVSIDWSLLDEYYQYIIKIKEKYELHEDISIHDLLQREEWLQIDEVESGNDELEELVLKGVEEAANQLLGMRIVEGNELEIDIKKQLSILENTIEQVKQLSPLVVQQYKERLEKRIKEFISGSMDEHRFITEVAIFADKVDINEELTRLNSHIRQFEVTLLLNEPIGRKLDFLLQEMNREVNTIGSKANDAKIAKEVIEMKSFLEKLKEQIQNIE
ncbi:YicC/YloC family endoribonuclease [Bacillus sp. CGMCC 1.16607]|uniref:YicC/YloC family endoribonuclease n=1 Tax=Bacillus sp. CGMCC 1.16607 TaxID=3351842 RepID=UPI003640D5AF